MSRRAKLYLLDEPIGGVDPAARDYILNTIVTNYDPEATVLISTHLIADVEPVLDGFVFLNQGRIVKHGSVDAARENEEKSLDELFREVFRCLPNC
jgi:ABC-2 type transport system ATP-binding protein